MTIVYSGRKTVGNVEVFIGRRGLANAPVIVLLPMRLSHRWATHL